MDKIIERLKAEKESFINNYCEKGKNDGLEWGKSASYEEIQYALKLEPLNKTHDNVISFNPTRDEVLGDYFSGIIEDDDMMGFEETVPGNFIPNEAFSSWEEGWVDGVQEFWESVSDKI
jgi:hypothetical protein